MAATSDEEMENLLSLADEISADFETANTQIQTLNSNLAAEINHRQSLHLTCAALTTENQRLKNLHLQTLNNLLFQLQRKGDNSHNLKQDFENLTRESHKKEEDHRIELQSLNWSHSEKIRVLEGQIEEFRRKCDDFDNLREEFDKLTRELLKKEEDHRIELELLNRTHDEKIRVLEGRTGEILSQKGADEATIYQLHRELILMRNRLKEVEEKYSVEVDDLRDCISVEQEEKKELCRKVRDLEKELIVSKAKMVDQQFGCRDNQLDLMKQKMMKLRRENEGLKRQLGAKES